MYVLIPRYSFFRCVFASEVQRNDPFTLRNSSYSRGDNGAFQPLSDCQCYLGVPERWKAPVLARSGRVVFCRTASSSFDPYLASPSERFLRAGVIAAVLWCKLFGTD